MPRKIANKEINDMRRIIEIMLTHPIEAHQRMWDFIIPSVRDHYNKQVKDKLRQKG